MQKKVDGFVASDERILSNFSKVPSLQNPPCGCFFSDRVLHCRASSANKSLGGCCFFGGEGF